MFSRKRFFHYRLFLEVLETPKKHFKLLFCTHKKDFTSCFFIFYFILLYIFLPYETRVCLYDLIFVEWKIDFFFSPFSHSLRWCFFFLQIGGYICRFTATYAHTPKKNISFIKKNSFYAKYSHTKETCFWMIACDVAQ